MEPEVDSLAPISGRLSGQTAMLPGLTRPRKAAIIVRLLINEGIDIPLESLPSHVQAGLADEIASMRYVDDATLQTVIGEFLEELERFGLSFPGGLDGTLALLGDRLSPEAAATLRAKYGQATGPDPWAMIASYEPARLAEILLAESPEIAAVALSKLPSQVAATVLGRMPGPDARRIAFAISRTAGVAPPAVNRIGRALADRLADMPPTAFDVEPEKRMGQILDAAPSATREDVLEGLAEEDEELAARVRMAVFTFADIPDRLDERDVPALIRAVDQGILVTAMAGADEKTQRTVDFILEKISQRMAAAIRDEVSERDKPSEEEAEAAMSEVTAALRGMESAGEITLKRGRG